MDASQGAKSEILAPMGEVDDQENRLRRFAGFFKCYMGVMPLVTAAVAPLLTMLNAIPIFESQRAPLATYSGLLGFLVLAWVFYTRGELASAMVDVAQRPVELPSLQRMWRVYKRALANMLPLALIVASGFCYLQYFATLNDAIEKARYNSQRLYSDIKGRRDVLEKWGQREPIFKAELLQETYLGIFLFAEGAFVVMALKEYA